MYLGSFDYVIFVKFSFIFVVISNTWICWLLFWLNDYINVLIWWINQTLYYSKVTQYLSSFFTKYFFSLTQVIIWMTTFYFYISNIVLKYSYLTTIFGHLPLHFYTELVLTIVLHIFFKSLYKGWESGPVANSSRNEHGGDRSQQVRLLTM